MIQYYWSDDRVKQLKRLWQEGLSASQVARALGGVSRSAVIGKVHRLGLAARGSSSQPTRQRTPRSLRPQLAKSAPTIALVEVDPLPLADGTFATMRTIDKHMCRWPIGNPISLQFHFCGRPNKANSPYCEAHAVRAHQPHRQSTCEPQSRRV
jgi:GcrA cell cycle regulator